MFKTDKRKITDASLLQPAEFTTVLLDGVLYWMKQGFRVRVMKHREEIEYTYDEKFFGMLVGMSTEELLAFENLLHLIGGNRELIDVNNFIFADFPVSLTTKQVNHVLMFVSSLISKRRKLESVVEEKGEEIVHHVYQQADACVGIVEVVKDVCEDIVQQENEEAQTGTMSTFHVFQSSVVEDGGEGITREESYCDATISRLIAMIWCAAKEELFVVGKYSGKHIPSGEVPRRDVLNVFLGSAPTTDAYVWIHKSLDPHTNYFQFEDYYVNWHCTYLDLAKLPKRMIQDAVLLKDWLEDGAYLVAEMSAYRTLQRHQFLGRNVTIVVSRSYCRDDLKHVLPHVETSDSTNYPMLFESFAVPGHKSYYNLMYGRKCWYDAMAPAGCYKALEHTFRHVEGLEDCRAMYYGDIKCMYFVRSASLFCRSQKFTGFRDWEVYIREVRKDYGRWWYAKPNNRLDKYLVP